MIYTLNSIYLLMKFFSVPGKPVMVSEFDRFWFSLSEEEIEYYRTVDLEMQYSSVLE